MILEKGDMFSVWGKTDLFLFTSNRIVNKRGLAVMGRGIAKQLADKHPEVRKAFGNYLRVWGSYKFNLEYLGDFDGQAVGFFMVKNHWAEAADLSIIKNTVRELADYLEEQADNNDPLHRVDVNFPGIGNGKLRREDVLPLLVDLPDNVHIWEYSDD